MKAWHVARDWSIDGMELTDLPEPVPGPGQVAVRIKAASATMRRCSLGQISAIDRTFPPRGSESCVLSVTKSKLPEFCARLRSNRVRSVCQHTVFVLQARSQ